MRFQYFRNPSHITGALVRGECNQCRAVVERINSADVRSCEFEKVTTQDFEAFTGPRITSYNVCYTKLLRNVLILTESILSIMYKQIFDLRQYDRDFYEIFSMDQLIWQTFRLCMQGLKACLETVPGSGMIDAFKIWLSLGLLLVSMAAARITSYNVCYTKLLRWSMAELHPLTASSSIRSCAGLM